MTNTVGMLHKSNQQTHMADILVTISPPKFIWMGRERMTM